jgi:hypothetical protein
LDASLGVANGLSQYLNQSLGEAISANAQIINAVAGAPNVVLVTLDHASICYTTAGPLNVTLPPIGNVGRMCEIIKASNDANTVTVTLPAGVTFVDGTTTFVLYNQNDYVDIICNPVAASWLIRGYRQRGLQNNGGFSGLAGAAAAQMGSGGATQTIGSPTPVAFTIYLFDNGLPNPYYATASPTKFLAPGDGIYEVQASVPVSATLYNTIGSVGTVNLVLRMNGNTYGPPSATATFITSTATTTTITCVVAVSGLLHMTSASYVEAILLSSGLASSQTITTGGGALGAVGQFSINQIG